MESARLGRQVYKRVGISLVELWKGGETCLFDLWKVPKGIKDVFYDSEKKSRKLSGFVLYLKDSAVTAFKKDVKF